MVRLAALMSSHFFPAIFFFLFADCERCPTSVRLAGGEVLSTVFCGLFFFLGGITPRPLRNGPSRQWTYPRTDCSRDEKSASGLPAQSIHMADKKNRRHGGLIALILWKLSRAVNRNKTKTGHSKQQGGGAGGSMLSFYLGTGKLASFLYFTFRLFISMMPDVAPPVTLKVAWFTSNIRERKVPAFRTCVARGPPADLANRWREAT